MPLLGCHGRSHVEKLLAIVRTSRCDACRHHNSTHTLRGLAYLLRRSFPGGLFVASQLSRGLICCVAAFPGAYLLRRSFVNGIPLATLYVGPRNKYIYGHNLILWC